MGISDFQYYFPDLIPFEHSLLTLTYAGFLMEFDLADSSLRFSHKINTGVCSKIAPYKAEWFLQAGQNLAAVDMLGEKIFIYDVKSGSWSDLNIDCHQNEWGNILNVFAFGECVYIVPGYREHIVRVNTTTKKVSRLNCPFMKQMDSQYMFTCIKENTLYLFDGTGGNAFILNIETGKYRSIEKTGISGEIASVQFDHVKDRFLILYGSGKVKEWKEQGNVSATIIEGIEKTGSKYFAEFVITDQNIWILPALGKDIYVYFYADKTLKRYEKYPEGFSYLNYEGYYRFLSGRIRTYQDKMYFGMHSANYLLCIDRKTGAEKWFYPEVPTMGEAYFFRQCHGLYLMESEKDCPLDRFLQEIPQLTRSETVSLWKEKTTGDAVWEAFGGKNEK